MINRKALKRRLERLASLHVDQRMVLNIDDCIKRLENGEVVNWERYLVTPKLKSIIEQLADKGGGDLE